VREAEISKNRINKLKSTYGLTLSQYETMLRAQNACCAICGKPEVRVRMERRTSLNVDHDHTTGKVRALLCYNCNSGLGHFKDSPNLLWRAAAYLRAYGKTDAD